MKFDGVKRQYFGAYYFLFPFGAFCCVVMLTGQVLRGTIPLRGVERTAYVHILASRDRRLQVRVTPIPDDQTIPSRHDVFWCWQADLEMAIKAGLMEPATPIPCPSCGGTMRIWDGEIGNRLSKFYSCSDCDECFEI